MEPKKRSCKICGDELRGLAGKLKKVKQPVCLMCWLKFKQPEKRGKVKSWSNV